MGASQQELRALTREEIRIDPNGKIWDNNTIDAILLDAYLDVQKDGQFNFDENQELGTITTTSGTREYDLASDFIRLEEVIYNGKELRKTSRATVLRNDTDDQTSGKPTAYYLYGGKIGFDAIPDSGFTVKYTYKKKLPDITDSQGSELPTRFDRCIALRASYLAFRQPRGNANFAQEKLAFYQEDIASALVTYLYNDLNTYSAIKRR